jgi:DNA polymerase I
MTTEMKRKKLILIDGHAIIHRAFHAVPEGLSTSIGEPVNATFGFTSMLMKALQEERPDYIAVTFDRPSPTFRHVEYALYKAHRPALPDNMKPQFARIREVVQAFGIKIYEKDGFEADDVLGTLSVQADALGVDTIIYTGDMDTLQLVTNHVLVKVAKRGITEVTEYNEKGVEARYGFAPQKLPDFKGLAGDKSDNIPGVPGIGEKTASRLIAEYGDLETLLTHLYELKPKEQKLLSDFSAQARQSKHLATIVLNVPVQLDLMACSLTHIDSAKVFTLFRQLEFRTLVERVRTLLRELGISENAEETSGSAKPAVDDSGVGEEDRPIGRGKPSLSGDPPIGVVPIILPPLPFGEGSLSVTRSYARKITTGASPGEASVSYTQLVETTTIGEEGSEQEAGSAQGTIPTVNDESLQQLSLFDVRPVHAEVVHKLHLPPSVIPSSHNVEIVPNAASVLGAGPVPSVDSNATNTQVITSEEGLQGLIKRIEAFGAIALDTETSSEDPRRAELVGISLAVTPGEAYYIPVGHTISLDGQGADIQLPLTHVIEGLKPLLENDAIAKYMHNAKYDMAILARYGVSLRGLKFDTMLGAYLADPGRRGLGLKDQVFQRLNHVMTPIAELIGSGSKMISMAQVPIRKAADYAGADADMTLRLVNPIRAELEQHHLLDLYERVEQPLITVLMQMELYGVALDADFLREFGATLDERLQAFEQEIYSAVGHRFNINSTKQLAEILFVELKLPTGKKTKTGYSVNADVIESLRGKHPVVDHILDYRQLNKLKSTYVDGLLSLMDPQTGRVYTSFNQTIASSGRLSSSNPNLQNIPVRTEIGRQIRRAFTSDPSYILLTADYSQFELRILAYITNEPRLIEAFTHDEDIHTITASSLFGVSPELVTKDQRRLAKTVVYAVLYGQSAFGLSQVTGMSNADAADFIRRYHETFPGIKGYVEKTLQQARAQGYVNTLFGRKRFFPNMESLSHTERQALEREAINMPIQGSNADLIKIAMIQIQHALKEWRMKTRMVLQVHDELVFEVPVEELGRAQRLIRQKMEGVATFMKAVSNVHVPLKVEIKTGKNWLAAEPMV